MIDGDADRFPRAGGRGMREASNEPTSRLVPPLGSAAPASSATQTPRILVGGSRQVLGRRNWLFLGSEDGAVANTTFVSLLASARLHGIEPVGYIRDLLCLLPSWPKHRALDLAPLNWATTVATEEVAVKLAANRFRQAVLASRV